MKIILSEEFKDELKEAGITVLIYFVVIIIGSGLPLLSIVLCIYDLWYIIPVIGIVLIFVFTAAIISSAKKEGHIKVTSKEEKKHEHE